jgi:hypothetical protein
LVYSQSCKNLSLLKATSKTPFSLRKVKETSFQAGFKIPKKCSLSSILARSMGKATRTKKGWEIKSFGRERLVECGFNYKQTIQINPS